MKRFSDSISFVGLLLCLVPLGFSQAALAGSGPPTPTTLSNPQPSALNYFYGTSAALTPDGTTAIVGANDGGYGLSDPPAVYVFQYANGAWGSTPIITLCDPAAASGCSGDAVPNSSFGSAVAITAINSNSFTVAVSSPGGGLVNGNPVSYGVVYIYQCTLGTTPGCASPVALADPGLSNADQFGSALAIAQDASVLLVGAWGTNEPGGNGTDDNNEGAVYVYTNNSGVWITIPHTLTDPSPTCADFGNPATLVCDEFGYAIAVSGTGNNLTALIGAPGAVVSNNGSPEPGEGAAFFLGNNGNGALQPLAEVTQSNTAACSNPVNEKCDEFGYAVALSSDSSTALVGAPNAVHLGTPISGEDGVANTYYQTDGSWSGTSTAGIIYTNPNTQPNFNYTGSGGFGSSLALSSNGTTKVIGMPEGVEGSASGGYGGSGEVDEYICSLACINTPSIVLVDPPIALNPAAPPNTDYFGAAVAVSQDGGVLLAGAPDTIGPSPGNAGDNGLAYVYGTPAPVTPVQLSLSMNGPNNVSVNAGQEIDYSITVTNTGNSGPAVNVTLTDTLPAGVTVASNTSGGASCSDRGTGRHFFSCTLASLAPGASWTLDLALVIDSSDVGQTVKVVSISVRADNTSSNPSASASVTVSQSTSGLSLLYEPALTLINQFEADNANACQQINGQQICFPEEVCVNAPGSSCLMLIYVRNTSTTQPADNVGMIMSIPVGMTVSNVNAGQGSCFLVPGNGSIGDLGCGLGTLGPGGIWYVIFDYTVNSTDTNGQAENSQATVSAQNMPSVSQTFDFDVGRPTTATPSTGGGAASVGWLELLIFSGLLGLAEWRRRGYK